MMHMDSSAVTRHNLSHRISKAKVVTATVVARYVARFKSGLAMPSLRANCNYRRYLNRSLQGLR